MKCTDARKFLYAFADGQLSVRANCELLDHLKMCSSCSRVVDEHQALRSAIGRSVASAPVPSGLRASVTAALSSEQDSAASVIAASGRRVFSWKSSFLRPRAIATAAVLALAITGTWLIRPSGPAAVDGGAARAVDGRVTAAQMSELHLSHAALGRGHQGAELPATLGEAAGAITRRLGGKAEVSPPNLSSFGFDFESANLCRIHDGERGVGGHIVYASRSGGEKISFFVAPKFAGLDQPSDPGSPIERPFMEYELASAGSRNIALLAWHQEDMTVVCCGDVNVDDLKLWVGAIRTAMADFDGQLRRAREEMIGSGGVCNHGAM